MKYVLLVLIALLSLGCLCNAPSGSTCGDNTTTQSAGGK